MLQAIQSTQIPEQYQNGRTAEELTSRVSVSLNRYEVEVQINPHRNMMRASAYQYVIRITVPAIEWIEDSRTLAVS